MTQPDFLIPGPNRQALVSRGSSDGKLNSQGTPEIASVEGCRRTITQDFE